MTRAVLSVPNISCGHCERAITEALEPQAGIQQVKVDIEKKLVALEFDESQINLDKIGALLDEEGYPIVAGSD